MRENKRKENEQIPKVLRNWFVVHFAADILFALPLFLVPVRTLTLLGWKTVDPISARMTAAALFGIGIESLLSRNAGVGSFRTMLSLKIIWSLVAVIGLFTGLVTGVFGYPIVGVILLSIFVLFNTLWVYWFVRIKKLQRD
ncbi:MAG: hypothetical protein JEY99_01680 [Spirochaetales bacterium]|nr:hypothetical protein [Spirochaetales bacterium]